MLVFVRKIRSTTHSNAFFLTLWHKVPLDAQNAPKSNRHWQSTCYKAAFRNSLLWLYQHSTSTSQYKHISSVKTSWFSPRRNVLGKSMQRVASAYATWSISRHLTLHPPEHPSASYFHVRIFPVSHRLSYSRHPSAAPLRKDSVSLRNEDHISPPLANKSASKCTFLTFINA